MAARLRAARHTALNAMLARLPLVLQLVRREVIGRYRGSLLGLAWSFLNPLFMLAVYTLVFSTIFRARWGGEFAGGSTSGFALMLFSGLVIHGLFGEIAGSTPALIRANVNYVKKVVFPLQILPVASLGTALFHAFVSVGVLLVFELILVGRIPATALLWPLVIAPFALFLLGLGWFLASLGVYLRDIAQVIAPIVTAMLFLSPVFYPLDAAPQALRPFLVFNPLTLIIENSRKVLIYGQSPDLMGLSLYALLALVFASAGYWWFQKTRKGFADVL